MTQAILNFETHRLLSFEDHKKESIYPIYNPNKKSKEKSREKTIIELGIRRGSGGFTHQDIIRLVHATSPSKITSNIRTRDLAKYNSLNKTSYEFYQIDNLKNQATGSYYTRYFIK